MTENKKMAVRKLMQQRLMALVGLVAASVAVMAQEPSYKVNPGDILEVYVWNEESLSREAVVVRPDGFISVPLAGDVRAGGVTTREIEAEISQGLKKFLRDEPTVTVSIRLLDGYKIYVLGKVNRPGEYKINSPTDVAQALALAGGLNSFAAENNINILRRNPDGSQQSIAFEYGDVKEGEKLRTNITLQSGDVVVVP